ncbi:MAG: hypothetical protein EP299_12510 [Acidobacteria bacterium]|nr:MAG: hypothetical protein EP299_12510 [Acidobacteriota bacterium]
MNWTKAIIAGVVGGVVLNLADWVMHGMIMGSTYTKYEVFTQEPANPAHFFLVAVVLGVASAIFFARTRGSWPAGIKGGVVFGAFLGLVLFFRSFYNPLVLEGFPYYLSWCWGGINFIGSVILGAVLGAMYKS